MTIYAVLSGPEYDQAGIDGLFSTRELAESYIAETPNRDHFSADPFIAEYELDPKSPSSGAETAG
jgi:hypothetical protein